MSYKFLFFDLDGTITNSMDGIFAAVRYSFEKMGYPDCSDSELRKYIGPPLTHSYRHYAGMSEQEALQALHYYREFYSEKGVHMNRLYDGVADMLKALHGLGKRLFVATSKPEEQARIIIENNGILPYFSFVGGATLDNSRCTKEQVLSYVLQKAGSPDVSQCLMIGDRKYDCEGAAALGIDCVGVSWGFAQQGEFNNYPTIGVISAPQQLVDIAERV